MQYLGISSVIYLSAALAVMLLVWPPDVSKTLSQNAARGRSSIIYYAIALGIFLIMLTVYILSWFVPHLGLGPAFSLVYIIGATGQAIALAVPETTGVKVTIHRTAAFAMTLSLMALTGMLTLSSELTVFRHRLSVIIFAWMIFSWVMFLFVNKTHKYSLIFQLLYSYLFLILVII